MTKTNKQSLTLTPFSSLPPQGGKEKYLLSYHSTIRVYKFKNILSKQADLISFFLMPCMVVEKLHTSF